MPLLMAMPTDKSSSLANSGPKNFLAMIGTSAELFY